LLNPQAGGPPLVDCPRLLIQYIRSYHPELKASPHKAGSPRAVAEEVSKYKLELVGVQVRWDGGGTEPAVEYTFLYGKGNENHELGTGYFVHKRIIVSSQRMEFISHRMSYIRVILRGRWCNIIVLNVHAPTEDKIDDIKDRFYEELE
jgi:hypothetical protein